MSLKSSPKRARYGGVLREPIVRLTGAFLLAFLSAGIAAGPTVAADRGRIDTQRLLNADREPEQWLTSGRDFGKTHYSPLAQIDRNTVGRLGFAWNYDTGTTRGLEATPIVVDGVMYTSGVAGRVYALDAASGALIWKFEPDVDMQVVRSACCDDINRGVAVWKGKVYVAALDGMLYALDAADGKMLWKVDTIVDHKRGYSSTGAPQIAGRVVVIGNAGGEYDARGYISAYDLDSGMLAWRFYTVPGGPSAPDKTPAMQGAAGTWARNSRWQYGGGGVVWGEMVYDPQLDLLYAGTGNAVIYPRLVRSPTGGANLYTCSVLAIDPNDGRLVWYYQETPGDQWDYDSDEPMILTDLKIDGVERKVLLHAPKNGFFYVLDRKTGKLISASKFVAADWATRIDVKSGMPVQDHAAADYSRSPKFVYPSTAGGHNWNPMAYSARTGLVYLPVTQMGNIFLREAKPKYRAGLWDVGVRVFFAQQIAAAPQSLPADVQPLLKTINRDDPNLRPRAYLLAYDPVRQKPVWQGADAGWWDHAGVLATGGGLVVQGTGLGHLRVYDDRTGRLLKDIDVGTTIIAAPMTYMVRGIQYIAVMAAWGGGGWSIPHHDSAAYIYGNEGRILAFKLDAGETPKPKLLGPPPPIPAPPASHASGKMIEKGAVLFNSNCAICHSNDARSGAPDLRRMTPEVHDSFAAIVLDGAFKNAGMPAWGDVLSLRDATAIHAYLISLAQHAYADQKKSGGKSAQPEIMHGY